MNETKACPYCSEQVLATAIKCKHCGSSIGGPTGTIRKQFKMSPAFVVLGGIVIAIFGAGWAYNWQKTGTPSGIGFSDEAISSIKSDIRDEFAKRRGITVEEVQMLRESPRKLTGFVKVKAPLLGTINKACTATMGDDGRSIWRCE
jgi:hypothetical protein